jgi:hypothetical protein
MTRTKPVRLSVRVPPEIAEVIERAARELLKRSSDIPVPVVRDPGAPPEGSPISNVIRARTALGTRREVPGSFRGGAASREPRLDRPVKWFIDDAQRPRDPERRHPAVKGASSTVQMRSTMITTLYLRRSCERRSMNRETTHWGRICPS